jgi:hypothetical protein
MLQELSNTELQETNGGHHGAAYEAGEAVGDFIGKIGVVIGVIAFFMN